jgi:choline dehydrogenase-like flavoprotein
MSKVFVRAAQEAGLPYNPDFNGERQEGCGLYQVTQRNGRRSSAAIEYLRPALRRPNLVLRECGMEVGRPPRARGGRAGSEIGTNPGT